MKKPSVTELCDILNKPTLMRWANKQGLLGIDISKTSLKYKTDGSSLHKEVEDYLINGVIPNDLSRRYLIDSFFSGCSIISMEESFENDKFKGRCDIRFIKDGVEYVGDFKSKFKRPYIEHFIQLVSYRMHFGSDAICIIDLRDFHLHQLSLFHYEKYEKLVNSLIDIYNIKQELI